MANHQTMSMEAALDEERLAVLELMEGMNKPAPQKRQRDSSGSLGAPPLLRGSSPTTSPRSPMRSMLDIADDSIPRHSSIAGTSASGISQPVRSMLDIGPPPTTKKSDQTQSANTSPTDSAATSPQAHNRTLSDAVNQPPSFGPRGPGRHNGDITDDYQFSGYLQSNPGGPVAPKRNTLAGKKLAGNAMADAMSGNLGAHPKDRGRSLGNLGMLPGINVPKSRSPHNRLGMRSASPATTNSNMLVMDSGLMVDKDSAYRRLSDANLALAGGSFASLAHRKKRDSDTKGRLTKDYSYNEEGVVESSDDDSGSDDGPRGRKHRSSNDDTNTPLGLGKADNGSRVPKSLMAAAEEERQSLVDEQKKKSYKVKSLLEPEIKVTGPGGEKLKIPNKTGVHPSNAFDLGGASGITTPHDSDTEQEISDIRRAQRLAILLTPISSKPETQRSVRTLFRGDFAKMQKDAREEGRKNRKYLVATDLSEEAAHALEWTVGTVLRDGDTMLAIYCVDEETGINSEGVTASLERQAEAIAGSAVSPPPSTLSNLRHSIAGGSGNLAHVPSPLGAGTPRGNGTPRSGHSPSPLTRNVSHAEQERYRAVEDITERVSKLLRKTKLQVRVVVEVIHCKSPKHLICEVIDYFEPTMVVLGSRGRSALKGVILGSFSNYLVTKSSVPVMVARKRLRKHVKYRKTVKLANNLTGISTKRLASAKID